MKITCETCGAKYTIADDKVLGRKVKIRCKGCSTPIVVDGQKLGPSGAPASPDARAETLVPNPSPDWSVNFSETDQRTMTTQQIVEAWQSGQITGDVYVWKEGMGDWVPLHDCAELAPFLSTGPAAAGQFPAPQAELPLPPGYGVESGGQPGQSAAPEPEAALAPPAEQAADAAAAETPAAADLFAPPPATASSAPAAAPYAGRAVSPARARTGSQAQKSESAPRASAARVSGGRSLGAQDLFAGVESAGSETADIPITGPSLPQAGSTAYADDRPTGARNENSVLFSLDSLKVANPGGEDTRHHSSEDPFGMGGGSGVANIGGGNPLFTLADNQRLLTAPPPPPEPEPRPVQAAVGASIPPQLLGRNMILLGVGAALLVLFLGVSIGAVLSGDDKESTSASADAQASAAPADKKDDKNDRDDKKDEETAKAPAAEPPPTASAETAKPSEKAEDAKAADAKPGTNGGKPVARKDTKKEEAPAPAADQPFNRGAAVAAMGAAASQAAGCKKPGGPTGSGKATLTFAPTGRVTSATVDTAPFAGTAVGGCVASIFRRAKVPPFTGNSIRVSKSFSIPP